MKNKKMLLTLSVVCMSSLILTTTVTSYGELLYSGNITSSISENREKIKLENEKNLKVLENELKLNNTSVNEQLDKFLEEDLKYFSPEEAELVKQMINSNRPSENSNRPNEYGDIRPSAYLPDYEFNQDASDMLIANAAIAYFKLHNYTLSAHLLSRALSVKSRAEYQPSNSLKHFLYNTVAYRALSNKKSYPDGSYKQGEFRNLFNRDEADAYYSIHGFEARMTHNRIMITDQYDYDEDTFTGAAGVAVDALARLQRSGKFVDFPLRIHLKR